MTLRWPKQLGTPLGTIGKCHILTRLPLMQPGIEMRTSAVESYLQILDMPKISELLLQVQRWAIWAVFPSPRPSLAASAGFLFPRCFLCLEP